MWQNRTLFTDGLQYRERPSPEYDFLRQLPPLARVESVNNNVATRWKTSFYPSIFPGWLIPAYFGAHTFSWVGINAIPQHNFEYNALALPELYGVDGTKPLSPLLSLAGVKYIFSFDRLAPDPGLKLLTKGAEYYIYENMRSLPRVMLIPSIVRMEEGKILPAMKSETEDDFLKHAYVDTASPAMTLRNGGENRVVKAREDEFVSNLGHVKVARYEDEYVAIDCDINEESFFMITDTFFPGWKAYVGPRAVPIVRADYIYRGLKLSPGRYTLVMSYSPQANRWARDVSITVFIIAIILWAALGLNRRRLSL